ncbi:MAG TPA: molybdate ABC transporter substrate-binding protein [Candidatus Cybelea sp.]|nr:molybdate ABC transporter substrate-binding protein [Candidatus Cybelea sp.]
MIKATFGMSMTRTLAALWTTVFFLCVANVSVFAADLNVGAAASLKNALDEADALFEQSRQTKVTVSYAASPALAKQIENGSPADVFISADLDWMDYLDKKHLINADTRANLLRNEIVLIAPAASSIKVEIVKGFPLAQLLGAGRLAMADPAAVPAGKYGKAALEALGVWNSVSGKLAPAENVRAALLYVSRGEAPLGIVYRTDAAADRGVKIVGTFPPESHPPIVYPIAVTAASANPMASAYVAFLRSGAAAAAFEKQGFTLIK